MPTLDDLLRDMGAVARRAPQAPHASHDDWDALAPAPARAHAPTPARVDPSDLLQLRAENMRLRAQVESLEQQLARQQQMLERYDAMLRHPSAPAAQEYYAPAPATQPHPQYLHSANGARPSAPAPRAPAREAAYHPNPLLRGESTYDAPPITVEQGMAEALMAIRVRAGRGDVQPHQSPSDLIYTKPVFDPQTSQAVEAHGVEATALYQSAPVAGKFDAPQDAAVLYRVAPDPRVAEMLQQRTGLRPSTPPPLVVDPAAAPDEVPF
jgi:hypothetical protein